jgi:hypothetical protein
MDRWRKSRSGGGRRMAAVINGATAAESADPQAHARRRPVAFAILQKT